MGLGYEGMLADLVTRYEEDRLRIVELASNLAREVKNVGDHPVQINDILAVSLGLARCNYEASGKQSYADFVSRYRSLRIAGNTHQEAVDSIHYDEDHLLRAPAVGDLSRSPASREALHVIELGYDEMLTELSRLYGSSRSEIIELSDALLAELKVRVDVPPDRSQLLAAAIGLKRHSHRLGVELGFSHFVNQYRLWRVKGLGHYETIDRLYEYKKF